MNALDYRAAMEAKSFVDRSVYRQKRRNRRQRRIDYQRALRGTPSRGERDGSQDTQSA